MFGSSYPHWHCGDARELPAAWTAEQREKVCWRNAAAGCTASTSPPVWPRGNKEEATMTLTHISNGSPHRAGRGALCRLRRAPGPRRGVLQEYIPEPIRSKYFMNHRVGELIYYDAPDYAHAYAMRVDTFPDDGEFACTDPDLALRQAIMEAGADIAVLEPVHSYCRTTEATAALTYAHNAWQAEHWLDGRTTGTSGGAGRSAWPSRIPTVRPARSRSGPSTRTWCRC